MSSLKRSQCGVSDTQVTVKALGSLVGLLTSAHLFVAVARRSGAGVRAVAVVPAFLRPVAHHTILL